MFQLLALNTVIDKDLKDGTSLEEWKGFVETNKILGLVDEKKLVPIEYNW